MNNNQKKLKCKLEKFRIKVKMYMEITVVVMTNVGATLLVCINKGDIELVYFVYGATMGYTLKNGYHKINGD